MDRPTLKKSTQKLLPIYPLSPRVLPPPVLVQSPNLSRPRTSSLNRGEQTNPSSRAVYTLPEQNKQKEFVIKSSKDRRTPEKRRSTPSRKNLQTLFKKVDEEEEKDFMDLIEHLK